MSDQKSSKGEEGVIQKSGTIIWPSRSDAAGGGGSPDESKAGGATLREDLKEIAVGFAGQENEEESVGEKTGSFFEEIAEYSGRVYGDIKKHLKRGGEGAKEDASSVGEYVKKGWNKEDGEGEDLDLDVESEKDGKSGEKKTQ